MPRNLYLDIVTFERRYNRGEVFTANERAELEKIIEAAAREVDNYCSQGTGLTHFYAELATVTLDGSGLTWLSIPDLLSLTTLKFDEDNDGTFEATLAAADYRLVRPYHARPYAALPRRRIVLDPNGKYARFPAHEKSVEIGAAEWGYGNDIEATGATVGAGDTGGTSLAVSSVASIFVGMTLKIESEYLYVEAAAASPITVKRGVNGSTAVGHASGTAISKRVYPPGVVEGTFIEVVRRWKRQEQGFSSREPVSRYKGLDEDAARSLDEFVRYS